MSFLCLHFTRNIHIHAFYLKFSRILSTQNAYLNRFVVSLRPLNN
ncbi:hypothetical protein BACCOP_04143 [Phocaeicola coprocola DSM 17136]|uniref:Uncharacterized protein n=1 Tax=Phocaeicola coprocola DSM 17136 TaxID=470145 RepID=B3JQI3_9BACT|nr:hypothetical protein BACCOP_04143 [Phocaeicola coprocola DSM 17136]